MVICVGVCSFKSLRFLLTDTKVSRNTKTLVEGVARRKLEVRSIRFPLSSLPVNQLTSIISPP